MAALRILSLEEIEDLAVGAWILGTGGGGSPYLNLLNLRRLYEQGAEVALIDPSELAEDDLVGVLSTIGAPLVSQERLADSRTAARAASAMEEYLGRKFAALMATEIGGGNGLQPLLAAAHLGIPVVDADSMGRAFPEAQMSSFAVGNLPPYPLALVDIRGNEAVVTKTATWKWLERLQRQICSEVGSMVAVCKAPRSGREIRDWGIPHTTTQAMGLGRAVRLRQAQKTHASAIDAVLDTAGGVLLFRGKVHDIARRTTGGFLRGRAEILGLDGDTDHCFQLEFQNEWVIGRRDGTACVTTPDLICVLDTVSGEAIGTETLRYGQRVSVVALPSPPIMRTPRGLDLVGPRAFGYDLDFTSVVREG